jgi:hypothetical protein
MPDYYDLADRIEALPRACRHVRPVYRLHLRDAAIQIGVGYADLSRGPWRTRSSRWGSACAPALTSSAAERSREDASKSTRDRARRNSSSSSAGGSGATSMAEGICPNCKRPIVEHDADDRKRCHDALSGYRRAGYGGFSVRRP